ncbi:MAG TPA: hypothetical protein VIK29_00750 [Paludibacter sp.]
MSKLSSFFYDPFNELIRYYIGYKIQRLKRKADKYREESGSQMFIIKDEGKIKLISKRWFKCQRQHGKYPKSMTLDDLKKISYYYTRG